MIEASRTEARPEYEVLARALLAALRRDFALDALAAGRGAAIAVAGESGSGKSVTAASLARALERAGLPTRVLYQDDYFVRPPRANHEHRLRDLAHVGPHEVRLDLMQAHVAAFRARAPHVAAPLVDYPNDRFVERPLDFANARVLVVEGTYVLGLDDVDVRVFLEATHLDTAERRRARARDVDAPIVDRVLAIEHGLIAPQRARAQLVIDRDFALRRLDGSAAGA